MSQWYDPEDLPSGGSKKQVIGSTIKTVPQTDDDQHSDDESTHTMVVGADSEEEEDDGSSDGGLYASNSAASRAARRQQRMALTERWVPYKQVGGMMCELTKAGSHLPAVSACMQVQALAACMFAHALKWHVCICMVAVAPKYIVSQPAALSTLRFNANHGLLSLICVLVDQWRVHLLP